MTYHGFTQICDARKLVLALLFLLLPFSALSKEQVIRLANGEWPPYTSKDLPNYGLGSQIVSEAFAEVGIKVEYGFFPWKRSYWYSKAGKDNKNEPWHGTLLWIHTKEREEHFWYSNAVVNDEMVFYHLKEKPFDGMRIEAMEGKKIAGVMSVAYPKLEQAERHGLLKIQRSRSYDLVLKHVLYREIDATPLLQYAGKYHLAKHFTPEERARLTTSPSIEGTRVHHLLLSKAHPNNKQVMEKFNEGLQHLKESGRYMEIYEEFWSKYD